MKSSQMTYVSKVVTISIFVFVVMVGVSLVGTKNVGAQTCDANSTTCTQFYNLDAVINGSTINSGQLFYDQNSSLNGQTIDGVQINTSDVLPLGGGYGSGAGGGGGNAGGAAIPAASAPSTANQNTAQQNYNASWGGTGTGVDDYGNGQLIINPYSGGLKNYNTAPQQNVVQQQNITQQQGVSDSPYNPYGDQSRYTTDAPVEGSPDTHGSVVGSPNTDGAVVGNPNTTGSVVGSPNTAGSAGGGGGLGGGYGTGIGSGVGPGGGKVSTISNPLQVESIADLISKFADVAAYVLVLFGVLVLIYTGLQFVLAQGNSEELKTLRKQLLGVVIGIAIVIGARVIIYVVINTLSASGVVRSGTFNTVNKALQK